MADPVRERPKVSHQQFGNTAVSDNSLSFQGIVHGDVHLNRTSPECNILLSTPIAPSSPVLKPLWLTAPRYVTKRPSTTSTNVRLNLERPVTPPSPTAIIPFCRDLDFVERKEIIDRVHQLCANPAAQTALLGLGGVG